MIVLKNGAPHNESEQAEKKNVSQNKRVNRIRKPKKEKSIKYK
jgi:hypothetical protein